LAAAFVFEALDGDERLSFLRPSEFEPPWWLMTIFFATILALWVLSLCPPRDEGNRYGSNPRLGREEILA
jgi:hypothetical protein